MSKKETLTMSHNDTIVIGHKNPDTDSICSAICYARYKEITTGERYIPARAGALNPETSYVLDYFKVPVPVLVENVKTQISDIDIHHSAGVSRNISLKKAWTTMQENNEVTIAAVTKDNKLEGLITVGDITRSYMNVYDSGILAEAKTQYSNIVETLEGTMVVGDPQAFFDKGKVLVAAANPDVMEQFIKEHDLVILGNRYESQLCAIEMGADCLVVCNGVEVSVTIRKIAQEKNCTIITTPYDTYTVARLINQSMPISHFMKTDGLITFDQEEYADDIRSEMANKRFREFPVLDSEGHFMGFLSRRLLLNAKGKKVCLVDHNERTQAVDGIENADLRGIIDHHRLGNIATMSPVLFRNQPVGCTATILYQIYTDHNVEIDKTTAGLMLAAIISDTLLFRSPTFTDCDRKAADALAKISGEDPEQLAIRMFSAGSELSGKTDEQILHQDYKKFNAGSKTFAVGQITSLNTDELEKLRQRMPAYMEKARESEEVDMMYLMLTNILTENTILLAVGAGCEQAVTEAFHVECKNGEASLKGVMSRKKQLIPPLTAALSQ